MTASPRQVVRRVESVAAFGGQDRDVVLLVLLFFLNLASLWTTTYGATQILPAPASYVVGFSIQGMLFTMLAGFAGQHAPLRRWFVVAVFSVACVYCSFFTYYGQLISKDEAVEQQTGQAKVEHAELVDKVFSAHKSESERLREAARVRRKQAEEERSRGSNTGVPGYGARAKAMFDEANELEVKADALAADVARLEPLFDYDLDGLSPQDIHDHDLAAWRNAPPDWKDGYPAPALQEYVDPTARVRFLIPFYRAREGDSAALAAIFLASLVDGMAILLGSAIERRQRRRRSVEEAGEHLATAIKGAKRGLNTVISAFRSERAPAPPPATEQELTLHIQGDAAEFLEKFVDAIHPETGHIATMRLHEKASFAQAWTQLVAAGRQAGWIREEYGEPHARDPGNWAWLMSQKGAVRPGPDGSTTLTLKIPPRPAGS